MSGGFNFSQPSAGVPTSGLTLLLDAGNSTSYSGAGNTWTDLSPSSKNGNIQANVSWVSNGASSYFNFAGDANDYVIVPQFTALNSATTFSQSTWFQLSSFNIASDGTWFSWGQNGTVTSVFFTMGGQLNPYIEIGTFFDGTSVVNPFDQNEWVNFTLTYNGNAGSTNGDRVKIYVNGVLTTLTNPGTSQIPALLPDYSTNANIVIGGQAFNITEGKLKANLAYTSVYDRALSSTEATNIFNALKSRYGY